MTVAFYRLNSLSFSEVSLVKSVSNGFLFALFAAFLNIFLAFSHSLLNHFFGLRVLYFFCLFIGRECFAVSSIISVKVLFAFSIPSELFVNDVAKKVWTLAFISLLLNAAL